MDMWDKATMFGKRGDTLCYYIHYIACVLVYTYKTYNLHLHYQASRSTGFAREQCGFIVWLCGGTENQNDSGGGRSGGGKVAKDQISSALHPL